MSRKIFKPKVQRIYIIKLPISVNSLIRQFTNKVTQSSKLSIFMKNMRIREEARALLYEWVKSESLRKHCLSVAVAMAGYAKKLNLSDDEIELYWMSGLLHDLDYERFPDINVHPIEGCKELRRREFDEEIITAILGHNEKTGIKRYGKMAKTLFAVDELCGLIMALAKVRPENFEVMSSESVKKAMKKKDFAAAINREDIQKGIVELEVSEDEHFELVINSLKESKGELGF